MSWNSWGTFLVVCTAKGKVNSKMSATADVDELKKMGASAPTVLVSRADSHENKLNSIALGSVIVANK